MTQDRLRLVDGELGIIGLESGYKINFDAGDLLIGNVAVTIPATPTFSGALSVLIDGGGSEIADAVKVPFGPLPVAMTVTAAYALADQSGSIVVDIWKDTYANYPPLDADSITASAPVTISSATKSTDSTLTGWTTALAAGSILYFNVDSCTTIQWCLITLSVTRGLT
jgi:uncharacterized membrane protein